MKIMRYTGNSAKESENRAKEELGSEVVILNTRKKKRSGFFGKFRKSIYETIAAVEEEKKNVHKKDLQIENKKENLESKRFINALQKNSYKNSQIENENDKLEEINISRTNVKDSLETMGSYFYENLIENGVEIKIAKRLIHMTQNKIENEYKNNFKMFPQILKRSIENYLGKIEPIKILKNQNVIFFIGPTGVGKTTTLAKIAAQYAMAKKEKIALITADTYRIAAVEQLKVYSEILDIPLRIVYDAKEIKDVLSNYNDKELVLVDTAGRSHNNQDKIDELEDIISSLDNKEVYLVLSATTDFSILKNIIKKYNFIDNYKIIFTKMDEVEKFGVILNTRFYTNKPLSYITTGQNVPEDINIVNIKKISKQLIGEK